MQILKKFMWISLLNTFSTGDQALVLILNKRIVLVTKCLEPSNLRQKEPSRMEPCGAGCSRAERSEVAALRRIEPAEWSREVLSGGAAQCGQSSFFEGSCFIVFLGLASEMGNPGCRKEATWHWVQEHPPAILSQK